MSVSAAVLAGSSAGGPRAMLARARWAATALPVARAQREGAAAGCPAARLDPAGDPQRACGLVRDHRRSEHGAPVSACPQRDAQKKPRPAADQPRRDAPRARRFFFRRQPALAPNRLFFIDETWAAT